MQKNSGPSFVVQIAFAFLVTGLLVSPGCCWLQSPIVSVAPLEAYVGQEVLVEATVTVLSG